MGKIEELRASPSKGGNLLCLLSSPSVGCLQKSVSELFKPHPKLWLSAHMHCYFRSKMGKAPGPFTEFLALDKPIKKSIWMEGISLEHSEGETKIKFWNWPSVNPYLHPELPPCPPPKEEDKTKNTSVKFCHDLEWLAITKSVDCLISKKMNASYIHILSQNPGYKNFVTTKGDPGIKSLSLKQILENKKEELNKLKECFHDEEIKPFISSASDYKINPQTAHFLETLSIESQLYPKESSMEVEFVSEDIVIDEFLQFLINILNTIVKVLDYYLIDMN